MFSSNRRAFLLGLGASLLLPRAAKAAGETSSAILLSRTYGAGGPPLILPGQNFTALIVSDSLGVIGTHGDLFGKFFTWIGTLDATASVVYQAWNTGTNDYDTAVIVQAGTGGPVRKFFVFAIGGSQPERLITEQVKGLVALPALDLVMFNHGKNMTAEQSPNGRYQSTVEMIRMAQTAAQWVHILQPPNRDDNNMSVMVQEISQIGSTSEYNDVVIDCYSSWVSANKPSSYYSDNLHPNDLGVDTLYLPNLESGWTVARRRSIVTPARLLTKGNNLLVNGDFSDWTGAFPASWTGTGIPAVPTKDTVFKNANRPYSCKLSALVAAAQMRQTFTALSAPNLAAMLNQYIWFAVLSWIPVGSTNTPGQIQLTVVDNIGTLNLSVTHTVDLSAVGQVGGQWAWNIGRTQRALGSSITAASSNLKLYCNSGATTTPADVWFDRAIMGVGVIPNDMFFAGP